jgi:hypothetical protein
MSILSGPVSRILHREQKATKDQILRESLSKGKSRMGAFAAADGWQTCPKRGLK